MVWPPKKCADIHKKQKKGKLAKRNQKGTAFSNEVQKFSVRLLAKIIFEILGCPLSWPPYVETDGGPHLKLPGENPVFVSQKKASIKVVQLGISWYLVEPC